MPTKSPSDLADKFMLRMPEGMREGLRVLARANHRSVNSEVVFRLSKVLADAEAPSKDLSRQFSK